MNRPATVERSTTLRPRAASLAETSPYRRATASTAEDDATDDAPPAAFGPFMVYEQLGEGGMAYVHRAEHIAPSGLRKEVALKRLRTDSSEDPDLVSAFVHEAQLVAKLQHPNIAQAYELGRIDNTYYIAMELVPGPTLSQVITQSRQGGAGAIPLSIALELLIQICDAVDHAHDLRDESGQPLDLIHRDISPANIIISRTGAAKLIDFGIAKVRSARATTEAGMIKGKHGYIAPEYTYGQLDRRADLFALGIVAHELLTSRRLFAADTELDTLLNVRNMPIPPPSRFAPGISAELDAIVLRALERNPETRWQNAGAMRVALVEEARRLGVSITGPQIRDWVEWAFQQTARRDSSVDRLLHGLDPSLSIEIQIEPARARTPAPAVAVDALAETVVIDLEEPIAEPTEEPAPLDPAPLVVLRPVTPSIAAPVVPAAKARTPVARRAPPWRAPTRWARPAAPRTAPQLMILLALVAFALFAIDQQWIDLERWRQLLGA